MAISLALALERAQLASLFLTMFLYAVFKKRKRSSSLADDVISIGRLFLRTFYDYDGNRVSQCLRKHSSTTHEGSPGVIRDASTGDFGTVTHPSHRHHSLPCCLSPSIPSSSGSKHNMDWIIERERVTKFSTKTSRIQVLSLNWPACAPCP